MSRAKNLVVAQSGGPTPVINNSLQGIIEAARDLGADRHGLRRPARHRGRAEGGTAGPVGPAGRGDRRCCGSRRRPARSAPAATSSSRGRTRISSGSSRCCRPTTSATSSTSAATTRWTPPTRSPSWPTSAGWTWWPSGVPKTIDNDVGDSEFRLIDHTPGYGSVARYWMHMVQNANEENAGSCPADPVLVMQAMGRKIGFIPAAARLADPEREMPLQIYLAESPCHARATGRPGERPVARATAAAWWSSAKGSTWATWARCKDAFGHTSFGSTRADRGAGRGELPEPAWAWPRKGAARGNVPGTDQRHSMAYRLAGRSGRGLRPGADGRRAGGRRARAASWPRSSATRARRTACVTTRCRWPRWPTASGLSRPRGSRPSGCDVTDEFVRYARPLVGDDMVGLPMVDGRQRLARFAPLYGRKETARLRAPGGPRSDAIDHVRSCTPQARLPGRDRFRRLRVRHDGVEAEGVLHAQHDQYWGLQGVSKYAREACRVRQPVLEEPGDQPLSGAGRGAGVDGAAAGGAARGVEVRIPPGADGLDRPGAEAGQPGAGEGGRARRRPGPAAHAGMVARRSTRGRADDGPRRAAVPLRPREPGKAAAARPTSWSSRPRRRKPCEREWAEHDLAQYVVAICGQEIGTKKECLRDGREVSARPHADDRRRAGRLQGGRGQQALFFPINPGAEEASWQRLLRGRDRAVPRRHVCRRVPGGAAWPSSIATCPSGRPGR